MNLKINVRETGNVVILDMSGRVTLGEEVASLRSAIRELLDGGQKNILLNLGDVTYIDSSGLGQMVGSYATITNQGGQLKLLNLQKKLHELMQVTKLITVFEVYSSEPAALASFGSAARSGAPAS